MNFFWVSDSFSKIEATSGRLEMTQLLADLLCQATAGEAEIIANIALGQIRPSYQGMQFNMAEKSVKKALAILLNESEKVIDDLVKKNGDAGLVVMHYEWRVDQNLTVHEVYKQLCNIEHISGVGSQELKIELLVSLCRDLDPLSAMYVIRIIIGKLRLGFSDMTILDALSWVIVGDKSARPIIEHAYNLCADIGRIAFEIKEGGLDVLVNQQIVVGIPIIPAAAERLPNAQAIVDKLGACVAQPKLDGFRVQIHLDKTKAEPILHFYSRNLQDMSSMFPDLAPALIALPVTTLIAEGEAIAYDINTGSFLPFQETVKRKRKHEIDSVAQEFPLKLFFFDLLYVDGESMLARSHAERRQRFASVVKLVDSNAAVRLIDEYQITTGKQLEEVFYAMIEQGLEGLVVKRPDAIYQPGKRNFNWIKLKRQDEGHLEDTLDCVVLGYYRGKGKRSGFGIGAFLVGLYNAVDDCFETVAKIGTGLTDEEWVALKKEADQHAIQEKPKNVHCAKELFPDVWVSPHIVCLVRADEITRSPLHTSARTDQELGYALRFPRFMGYRPEKGPAEATTSQEIIRLFENQKNRS